MVEMRDVVVANVDVLSTDIEDGVVMMDVESGNYYSLDAIASEIWKRLSQPTPVKDLCESLIAEFDAESDVITADVLALLSQLAERKLIEVAGA